MGRAFFMLLVLFMTNQVSAAIEAQHFADPQLQQRYQSLVWELRCPKCQNQNIGDSNAPIAQDLRDEVATLLREGKSDQDIQNYMVSRFGEFVLYRPKLDPVTWLLWFGPLLLLLVGGLAVWLLAGRSRPRIEQANTNELSDSAARLASLLKEDDR
ncbi:cytochrome c-type biogenesis protein CcmH [Pokkaliibacter sp. MBI-7]|uniref:cytochrome c-type biogenesis protein n=1 Tax=Pokkaliibacter sp. MBI-7 TaxID=3040600 RepID=UPI00244D2849|nr:cytochrome c-type biogenesis protein CcmH [Pokkaliibacter sp. MBI-7]MDH2431230.1 cytochrome c-type biogenesis protein CcmH [Pokkaliibacter sp. MBI-7]